MKNASGETARTIYDLARMTGLSKTTISSALSGNGRISSSTRERVLAAARAMNYEGNYYAQRLKKRCSQTIGLFSLDLDIGIETQKIKAIQRNLSACGYNVPIYTYGSYGGGEKVDQRALMSTLRRQRPQAIVCALRGVDAEVLDELDRYAQDGGVVVCWGYPDHKAAAHDSVVFDEIDNTYQAARYLLELGHREIGLYIPGARRPHEPRVRGLRSALRERNTDLREEWLFSTPELYDEGGARMAQRFLDLKSRPSALCIVNEYAASAFVNEIQRRGWRVPDDISLVSHDDAPVARFCAVPLTTVSHPVEDIANQVVRLLRERLENDYGGPARQITIKGQLVVRDSSRSYLA